MVIKLRDCPEIKLVCRLLIARYINILYRRSALGASVKISGTHWKCIENFRAIDLIRTANCILTYRGWVWGGACPLPSKESIK